MAAHGFSGLRVVDIADEAQVSHGALYGHFRDSNAVAREVFVGLIRRLYHVERPLRGQPGDPDAARRLVRRHLGALRDDGPLLIALRQALLVDARLARLADLAALYWRRRLEAAIVGPRVGAGEPAHPDILDLAIAGVGARAGREPMSDPVLDRLADEIVRGWLAARSRLGEAADAA